MNNFRICLALMVALIFSAVPAMAISNPSTGDNSIVAIIVGVMAAAAIGLIVVLLLTRNKK
ncbi:MAG: LPXTG cell wall anchor domain-containing protein [Angelakisella sp.]